jgi:flagellar FliJ protein
LRRNRFPETLIRLKQVQIDTVQRQVAGMEALITDLDRTANALESHIQAEQERTGIHDQIHFAYSTYAKATIVRRDNLKQSISGLKYQIAAVKAGLAEAPGK